MKSIKEAATSQNAKEIASWTQASLFTVGKSLRSAGSNVYAGLKTGYEHLASEQKQRERIVFLKFGSLEARRGVGVDAECSSCLMLALDTGFQVWTLEGSVKEVVSRRDGAASCMEALPLPSEEDALRSVFLEDWPLVAVASDAVPKQVEADGAGGASPRQGLSVSCVRLYSLRRQSYVHSLTLPGRVLGLCCSRRVLLVAMVSQIMAYDTATMSVTYSAITQPAPVLGPGGQPEPGAIPLALGPRWLAHASNQAVQSASGVAVGQRIGSGSWGKGPPGGGGSNLEAVQHLAGLAAKTSGRHMKSLGEAGYKYLSSQVENWRASHPPSSPSSSSTAATAPSEDSEVDGTVIVRDMVGRSTLAHFRAHTSPLLLLRFDASGTLLVTASVHGHTVNVFHLSAPPAGGGGGPGAALHLFRLSRGVTPAVIQDVGFSCSGEWLCVSSGRGTTHVFKLGLPLAGEGTPPHLAAAAMTPAERREFRPVKLVAAGRARGGAGVLNGSLPGSAAASAAVNLYNGSAGASVVASTFVPRQSSAGSPGKAPPSPTLGLEEDLMVITQEGVLTRHRLHVPPPPEHASPRARNHPPNGKRAEEASGELVVEAVEQFEVCRKLSWPEREDPVFLAREGLGEEGEEGQPLPWATYAETCLPCNGSPPHRIWADDQFQFLEMQDSRSAVGGMADNLASSSVLLVEEMPTKQVSLQSRGGLAPVKLEGAETAVLRGAHFAPQRHQRSAGR